MMYVSDLHLIHLSDCLSRNWNAPCYSFFHPVPEITHNKERRAHVFQCFNDKCCKKFRQFVSDKSTGNLKCHAESCWGEDMVKVVGDVKDGDRQKMLSQYAQMGMITAVFERVGKGAIMYSIRRLTKEQSK